MTGGMPEARSVQVDWFLCEFLGADKQWLIATKAWYFGIF